MSRAAADSKRSRLVLLHAERDLIVVNKPAGLLSIPSAPGRLEHEDSVLRRARAYAAHKRGRQAYAGMLHRLDRGTSGALAVALSRAVHEAGRLLFKAHEFDRTHLAIVEGVPAPAEGTIEAPIASEHEGVGATWPREGSAPCRPAPTTGYARPSGSARRSWS